MPRVVATDTLVGDGAALWEVQPSVKRRRHKDLGTHTVPRRLRPDRQSLLPAPSLVLVVYSIRS